MSKTTELSFKNDASIKEALIKRMDHHIEMDELMKGATGQNGKGCTVWCALNNGQLKRGYDHSAFPDVLGLPEWLARLHDSIFEGLTEEDSKWFSSQWVRAIPVGVDLTPIKWKFSIFLLKENIDRVMSLDISDELKTHVVNAIRGSLAVNESAIINSSWDESAARSAARSAESAARSAARSAESAAWSAARSAESAAESAARSARSAESAARSAWSAARSAWSAAWSAESAAWLAWSAARSAARSAAYKTYAIELFRLFSEA